MKNFKQFILFHREKKELILNILEQYHALLESETQRNRSEKEALESVKELNEAVTPEELRLFMNAFTEQTT